jgi:hypothetical protein
VAQLGNHILQTSTAKKQSSSEIRSDVMMLVRFEKASPPSRRNDRLGYEERFFVFRETPFSAVCQSVSRAMTAEFWKSPPNFGNPSRDLSIIKEPESLNNDVSIKISE